MQSLQEGPELIDWETLETVAPVIRNVAHPVRLRILDFLQQRGRACTVGEIVDACASRQALVSQQLRILRDQAVVTAKRRGNYILYSVSDRAVLLLLDCIRAHAPATHETQPTAADNLE